MDQRAPIRSRPRNSRTNFHVSLEAIQEALDYAARNRELIRQQREREAEDDRARGLDRPRRS